MNRSNTLTTTRTHLQITAKPQQKPKKKPKEPIQNQTQIKNTKILETIGLGSHNIFGSFSFVWAPKNKP